MRYLINILILTCTINCGAAMQQLTKTETFTQSMSVFQNRSLNISRIERSRTNSGLHNFNIPPVALCKKYPGCLAISQNLYNDGYFVVGSGDLPGQQMEESGKNVQDIFQSKHH